MKYLNEKEAMEDGVRVVAFDFDGTLAEYTDWNNGVIGDPIKDVVSDLIEEKESGSYVVIFSCRLNVRLWGPEEAFIQNSNIMDWLREHNLHEHVDMLTGDKPLAHEYVDDRAHQP